MPDTSPFEQDCVIKYYASIPYLLNPKCDLCDSIVIYLWLKCEILTNYEQNVCWANNVE